MWHDPEGLVRCALLLLQSAVAMFKAIEHWRARKPSVSADKGSRDCAHRCPGPSCGSGARHVTSIMAECRRRRREARGGNPRPLRLNRGRSYCNGTAPSHSR